MDRSEKKDFVAYLKQHISSAQTVVMVNPQGLNVSSLTALRQNMKQAGCSFKVVKNTLARLAVEGTAFECLKDSIKGPVAFAYSLDPIAPSRVCVAFAKQNPSFSIVKGALCSTSSVQILHGEDVQSLAALPSLEELRSKILGVVLAPMQQLVGVVQAPSRQIAQVLSAYVEKNSN